MHLLSSKCNSAKLQPSPQAGMYASRRPHDMPRWRTPLTSRRQRLSASQPSGDTPAEWNSRCSSARRSGCCPNRCCIRGIRRVPLLLLLQLPLCGAGTPAAAAAGAAIAWRTTACSAGVRTVGIKEVPQRMGDQYSSNTAAPRATAASAWQAHLLLPLGLPLLLPLLVSKQLARPPRAGRQCSLQGEQ